MNDNPLSNDSIQKEFLKLKYHMHDINSTFQYKQTMKDTLQLLIDREDPDSPECLSKEYLLNNILRFLVKNFNPHKISFFYLYFLKKTTQKEIAHIMNCSQVHVSLLLDKMVKKIQENADKIMKGDI